MNGADWSLRPQRRWSLGQNLPSVTTIVLNWRSTRDLHELREKRAAYEDMIEHLQIRRFDRTSSMTGMNRVGQSGVSMREQTLEKNSMELELPVKPAKDWDFSQPATLFRRTKSINHVDEELEIPLEDYEPVRRHSLTNCDQEDMPMTVGPSNADFEQKKELLEAITDRKRAKIVFLWEPSHLYGKKKEVYMSETKPELKITSESPHSGAQWRDMSNS